ncbi:nucleotide exchange factor GrpE [Buchnera aphidicola]|nr:nucleotide exchange factor GrpE [Buchnera aphidicola]
MNEIKIKDATNKKEIDNKNDNSIVFFKNKLEISKKKIEEMILKQNDEIFKIKNRLNSEVQKHQNFSLEKIITEFLSIIDNIERAVNLIKQKKENKYIEILKNIEHVMFLINNMFTEFNVSKINDIKIPFNPDVHQAISVQYTDKMKSNQVIEVMQSGYIICNSRLLRPAMVVVSKN